MALYASLLVSAIIFTVSYFCLLQVGKPFLRTLVIISVVSFLSTYLIFRSLLEIFIYRKIKLIYKAISSSRNSKDKFSEKMLMAEDILGNVNKEVIEWQKNRSEEIDELRRMENFRKEFLGNVSHELKTPLFNIQGYIHTLLEGAIHDPEVNLNYLQRAARSAERLCHIVDDLEAISKLESGELVLDQRTFDIHDLVQDVFESMELRNAELQISLRFKDGCDKPFYVFGDKDMIRQVITNLLVNSIKYGRKGGSTLVGLYDMDEKVLIEITDNGIGIDVQHLSRIFERFYRVDKSRSRDQGGTGLGLAIVKHIIEAHKQTINVRSTSGVGTTFAFTLLKQ
jgi:two-component system phosphate regulon sensor histidine kinase PhoR